MYRTDHLLPGFRQPSCTELQKLKRPDFHPQVHNPIAVTLLMHPSQFRFQRNQVQQEIREQNVQPFFDL
jgi:hypothetical protein